MASSPPNNARMAKAPYSPDWPVLRLMNSYRLVVVLALAAVYYLVSAQEALGQRSPGFFEFCLFAYCSCILAAIYLERRRWPGTLTQFYLQNYFDVVCLVGVIYASGGVQSGLGLLLLINIALLSQLTTTRYALLFAAIASSAVLSAELFASMLYGQWAADFEKTALLGILLFAVAWLMTVPLRRLMSRQITEPTKNRAALEAHEIATLNEEIIRELDSGVLVLNAQNQVVMINDTARSLLSAEFTTLPIHLGRLCAELMESLESMRRNPNSGVQSFTVVSSSQEVLPQFTPLSTGGVLIRIDDHSAIRQQFQQLKMASLGRLSASIAHEIRNPLSAISHATQLLQESDKIDSVDQQLLTIAHTNTHRINRIIEDILQLSNRQKVRRDFFDLSHTLKDFEQRFTAESLRDGSSLNVMVESDLVATFDTHHFDQVLWNICSNALLHNCSQDVAITINAYQDSPMRTVIDVMDDGRGIADIDREKLFEPFYSTHHEGCGLGLYIIRELCQLNKAALDYVESDTGAHFRIVLSQSQQMAA